MDEKPARGLRRDQKVFLILAAMFFVPLAVAWLWFQGMEEYHPEGGGAAKGELVQPPRVLGEFALQRVGDGAPVTHETLRGRWTVVYLGGAECDEVCRESLYEMRQVHVALGREAVRLQRLYVLVDADAPADPGYLAAEQRDLIVARADGDDPWLAHFDGEGRTWVIDPLGNLMMYYEADAPGRALFSDLKRLFRLSRVG